MDNAVALVPTYIRVNGYLTVTDYPVVEVAPTGGFQSVTDLDVLAFRFGHPSDPRPAARSYGVRDGTHGSQPNTECELVVDPLLGLRPGVADMITEKSKKAMQSLIKLPFARKCSRGLSRASDAAQRVRRSTSPAAWFDKDVPRQSMGAESDSSPLVRPVLRRLPKNSRSFCSGTSSSSCEATCARTGHPCPRPSPKIRD